MKPKQIALRKYPDINSAPVKRLLKWIISTVRETGGGVTYTQVKNFANSTERKAATSYDVKDILQTFLDHGRLQKVGYKYVLPQSPNKKQVAKKATEKKEVVNKAIAKSEVAKKATEKKEVVKKLIAKSEVAKKATENKEVAKKATEKKEVAKKAISKSEVAKMTTDEKKIAKKTTGEKEVAKMTTDKKKIAKKTPENKSTEYSLMQNVRNSPLEIEIKRSPGILQVRDTVMAEISPLDRDASNVNIFSRTMNDEMPSQLILPNIQSQTIGTAEPFQTAIAEEPLQNITRAELSKFFQNFNAKESAAKQRRRDLCPKRS